MPGPRLWVTAVMFLVPFTDLSYRLLDVNWARILPCQRVSCRSSLSQRPATVLPARRKLSSEAPVVSCPTLNPLLVLLFPRERPPPQKGGGTHTFPFPPQPLRGIHGGFSTEQHPVVCCSTLLRHSARRSIPLFKQQKEGRLPTKTDQGGIDYGQSAK